MTRIRQPMELGSTAEGGSNGLRSSSRGQSSWKAFLPRKSRRHETELRPRAALVKRKLRERLRLRRVSSNPQ